MRLRGRLEGRRVVPYYRPRADRRGLRPRSRARKSSGSTTPIELFFLQIQGSGRVKLDSGETMRSVTPTRTAIPTARSAGCWSSAASCRSKKPRCRASRRGRGRIPTSCSELLNQNASYVFFRELPADLPGPLGALGVPLTARRSIAVDPRSRSARRAGVSRHHLAAIRSRPLNRLMLAQDTGGAIRGAVRADFFWGFGAEAAREAGRMKQPLRMWVLLPNGFPVPPGERQNR